MSNLILEYPELKDLLLQNNTKLNLQQLGKYMYSEKLLGRISLYLFAQYCLLAMNKRFEIHFS